MEKSNGAKFSVLAKASLHDKLYLQTFHHKSKIEISQQEKSMQKKSHF